MITIHDGVFEIKATAGNTYLGEQDFDTVFIAAPLAPVVPIAPLERGPPRIVPGEARIPPMPMIPDIPPTPPMAHGPSTTRITPATTANGISVHAVESRGQPAHGIQGVPSAHLLHSVHLVISLDHLHL